MESTNKRTLTLLSSFQIVISVLFFVLGLVDGLEIRYIYSLVFSPCWIVPLVSQCFWFLSVFKFVNHLNLVMDKGVIAPIIGTREEKTWTFCRGIFTLVLMRMLIHNEWSSRFHSDQVKRQKFAKAQKLLFTVQNMEIICCYILQIILKVHFNFSDCQCRCHLSILYFPLSPSLLCWGKCNDGYIN